MTSSATSSQKRPDKGIAQSRDSKAALPQRALGAPPSVWGDTLDRGHPQAAGQVRPPGLRGVLWYGTWWADSQDKDPRPAPLAHLSTCCLGHTGTWSQGAASGTTWPRSQGHAAGHWRASLLVPAGAATGTASASPWSGIALGPLHPLFSSGRSSNSFPTPQVRRLRHGEVKGLCQVASDLRPEA